MTRDSELGQAGLGAQRRAIVPQQRLGEDFLEGKQELAQGRGQRGFLDKGAPRRWPKASKTMARWFSLCCTLKSLAELLTITDAQTLTQMH